MTTNIARTATAAPTAKHRRRRPRPSEEASSGISTPSAPQPAYMRPVGFPKTWSVTRNAPAAMHAAAVRRPRPLLA